MPQNIDSNFDALLTTYADIEVDRLDSCDMLRQFAYETLIERFRDMTEKELIEHALWKEMKRSLNQFMVTTHHGTLKDNIV